MFTARELVLIRKEIKANGFGDYGNDFTIELDNGEFRFISESCIDDILLEELSNDPYIVGCFNSWAIADATNMPSELIEIIQNAGEYEKLGQWIIESGNMEHLVRVYIREDGYGHHFATYDGEENEISFPLKGSTIRLYAFRVN